MRKIKNVLLSGVASLSLFGCACHEMIDDAIPPIVKEEKPTAVFDNISNEIWSGLKKEISLNGIEMEGNKGVVSSWGISIKYNYNNTSDILVLHKIKVRFPASFDTFGGWDEERVLNLVKEKLTKHGAKL